MQHITKSKYKNNILPTSLTVTQAMCCLGMPAKDRVNIWRIGGIPQCWNLRGGAQGLYHLLHSFTLCRCPSLILSLRDSPTGMWPPYFFLHTTPNHRLWTTVPLLYYRSSGSDPKQKKQENINPYPPIRDSTKLAYFKPSYKTVLKKQPLRRMGVPQKIVLKM